MKAKFAPGDAVVVDTRNATGHVRTPSYLRGKTGAVERVCGEFRKPEELAYGKWDGDRVPLYRVRFSQCDVWPDYGGPASDTLDAEIYEHWLEPVKP